MATTTSPFLDEIRELTQRIWFTMPEEVERFGKGHQPRGTGPYNQYFTPLMFAEGEARTFSDEILWSLHQVASEEDTDIATLKRLVSTLVSYKADFFDFVGLPEACAVVKRFVAAIEEAEDRATFVELVDAMLSWANRYHMWIDFVFPWGVANAFPRPA
jgi:hypothetical protein